MKTYSELIQVSTLKDRFLYLSLPGSVGHATFGFDRWVNQFFYRSREWRRVRQQVIFRDGACDLGVKGYQLESGLLVHHMNPLTVDDIREGADVALNPEYLITTSKSTHNAIHYGDEKLLPQPLVERRANDTTLWR